MSMFVSDERVPVTVDGQNIMYIRHRMDFGTRQKVMGETAVLTLEGDPAINIGAYNLALLTHNVIGWEGPEFTGMPCIPRNIARLDPDEPLVDMVLKEINDRNQRKESPDPKEAGTPGSMTSGERPSESAAATKEPSASMTPTLRLQTATGGRRRK